VAPGLKPYKQHESVFGVDYQLTKVLAFEARWDRRRLDHVIEDSAIASATGSETFVIVNPGQGINRTFSSFYNFLYPTAPLDCSTGPCPPNNTIPGARSYDGIEFRLTKMNSQHWFGMFSYTYSHLRGNYTGLTSTDIGDGGLGGRNSPNNSRSFDEPYFSWNAEGGSSSGLLPTDRPNTFKGYAYYEMPWGKFSSKSSSDFGIFQYFYSGTPTSSILDVGYNIGGSAFAPVDIVDRGKFVTVSQDLGTGAITLGSPETHRTPEYMQTDFNFQQNYKISEQKVLSFSATFANLFNQHAPTVYQGWMDSQYAANTQYISLGSCPPQPNGCILFNGPAWYAAAMAPYNVQQRMSQTLYSNPAGVNGPLTVDPAYGRPLYFQLARTIRLGVKFTF